MIRIFGPSSEKKRRKRPGLKAKREEIRIFRGVAGFTRDINPTISVVVVTNSDIVQTTTDVVEVISRVISRGLRFYPENRFFQTYNVFFDTKSCYLKIQIRDKKTLFYHYFLLFDISPYTHESNIGLYKEKALYPTRMADTDNHLGDDIGHTWRKRSFLCPALAVGDSRI